MRLRVLAVVPLVALSWLTSQPACDDPKLPLCATCIVDDDCESSTCKQYGDGQLRCSTVCDPMDMVAPECASPAPGGCNAMGYCMCQ